MNLNDIAYTLTRIGILRISGDFLPQIRAGIMGDGYYIQIYNEGLDTLAGRKWYISSHSVQNEVIQTCLRAWLDWLEHEGRECFTFDGENVASPHFNYEDLAGSIKDFKQRTQVRA